MGCPHEGDNGHGECGTGRTRKEGLHLGTLKGVTAEPMRKVRAKGHENPRKAAGGAHGAR